MHIEGRCDPAWLQRQLGHASIRVTMDTYGQWAQLSDPDAADALGSQLLGNTLATGSVS
jgi:integrase